MDRTLLSILVPVYNERYTIEDVLHALANAPLPEGVDREIVVVDDGSTDGTRDVLAGLDGEIPGLRLHPHDHNQGKGAAICTAISAATGDIAIIQDADLEYDPAEIQDVIRPILQGDADAVYGSRFLPRSRKRVLQYWHSVGNRFLTALSNMCTDLDLTDMETCYKAVKLPVLRSIPIRSKRFGIEPELTAKLAKRGLRLYEVPISYHGRTYHQGKKITWRDGIKAVFTILYFTLVDDLYDERYTQGMLSSLSRTHRLDRWTADMVRPHLGDRVLELGAGLGSLTVQLLPRESYCATDTNPLHLDFLATLFARQPRVAVRRLAADDPVDFSGLEERFDTVAALSVLERVEDEEQMLRNIHTALEPGGRAVVLVPRGHRLHGSYDRALGYRRRYEAAELRDKLEAAGLAVERCFTFNRVAVPAWFLNSRLLRRKRFTRIQLKLFDATLWLWRRIDRVFPWKGLSLVAVARKAEGARAP